MVVKIIANCSKAQINLLLVFIDRETMKKLPDYFNATITFSNIKLRKKHQRIVSCHPKPKEAIP